jgi:hypothetical protein
MAKRQGEEDEEDGESYADEVAVEEEEEEEEEQDEDEDEDKNECKVRPSSRVGARSDSLARARRSVRKASRGGPQARATEGKSDEATQTLAPEPLSVAGVAPFYSSSISSASSLLPLPPLAPRSLRGRPEIRFRALPSLPLHGAAVDGAPEASGDSEDQDGKEAPKAGDLAALAARLAVPAGDPADTASGRKPPHVPEWLPMQDLIAENDTKLQELRKLIESSLAALSRSDDEKSKAPEPAAPSSEPAPSQLVETAAAPAASHLLAHSHAGSIASVLSTMSQGGLRAGHLPPSTLALAHSAEETDFANMLTASLGHIHRIRAMLVDPKAEPRP